MIRWDFSVLLSRLKINFCYMCKMWLEIEINKRQIKYSKRNEIKCHHFTEFAQFNVHKDCPKYVVSPLTWSRTHTILLLGHFFLWSSNGQGLIILSRDLPMTSCRMSMNCVYDDSVSIYGVSLVPIRIIFFAKNFPNFSPNIGKNNIFTEIDIFD